MGVILYVLSAALLRRRRGPTDNSNTQVQPDETGSSHK